MQTIYSNSPTVYRGTVAGLRFSPLDGTAFVDGLPQAILDLIALYPGALLFEPYDASNRKISGVLKAVGTEETLSAELITGWTNGWPVSNFDTFTVNANGHDITQAVHNGTGWKGAISNNFGTPAGKLYKQTTTLTYTSGGGLTQSFNSAGNIDKYKTMPEGAGTFYYTALPTGTVSISFNANGAASDSAILYSAGQVTAPSTSGATIVTLKSGTVYNFAVNQWVAGSYNAASYYVVIKLLR